MQGCEALVLVLVAAESLQASCVSSSHGSQSSVRQFCPAGRLLPGSELNSAEGGRTLRPDSVGDLTIPLWWDTSNCPHATPKPLPCNVCIAGTMKVIRKKVDPNAPAQAPSSGSAARPGIKIVNRAPPPPVVSQEEVESGKVAKLLERLTLGEHDQYCDGHTDIDGVVTAAGFASLQANGLLTKLKAETEDMNNADAREAALLAFKQLCQSVGRPCEPYVVPLLPVMLDRMADKSAQVRDAALAAAQAVVAVLCPHAVELVLPGEWKLEPSRACAVSSGFKHHSGSRVMNVFIKLVCGRVPLQKLYCTFAATVEWSDASISACVQ